MAKRKKMRVDGVKQLVSFFNLDIVISVGDRVRSQLGIQFKIWVANIIKE